MKAMTLGSRSFATQLTLLIGVGAAAGLGSLVACFINP